MSKELQCNTSTLGVRLHRGRKMLADSLTGRGITMNAAIVGAILSGVVDTFVRDNLVHACTHAAVQVASGQYLADATISSHVATVIRSATAALRWSQLKAAVAAIVLLISAFAGGAQAL